MSYVLLFLILGGLMTAWLVPRWARKKAGPPANAAFEHSLQVAVREAQAHQMMLEHRSPKT